MFHKHLIIFRNIFEFSGFQQEVKFSFYRGGISVTKERNIKTDIAEGN